MLARQRTMLVSHWRDCMQTLPSSIRFRFTSSTSSSSATIADNDSNNKANSASLRLVASTQAWLERVVVGQKLCPFASPLLSSKSKLRIVASTACDTQQAADHVAKETWFLLRGGGICGTTTTATTTVDNGKDDDDQNCHDHHPETTLVVFDPQLMPATVVQDYRDFVRFSWTLQEVAVVNQGFTNEVQIVLFHPHATHQTYSSSSSTDSDDDDPANYTLRSPYPTVHLLREQDVMRAVTSNYPNLTELPTRNKARLRSLGVEACQRLLKECYHDSNEDDAVQAKK